MLGVVGKIIALLAQKFWAGLHWLAHNFSQIIAQKQVHGKSLYSNCVAVRSLIFLLWTLETPIDHPDAKIALEIGRTGRPVWPGLKFLGRRESYQHPQTSLKRFWKFGIFMFRWHTVLSTRLILLKILCYS